MSSDEGILTSDYVRTDIPRDVLVSVQLLELALSKAEADSAWWKWAIVGAHMAASTSLIGYLTTTSGVGALTDQSTTRLLEWYENRGSGANYPSNERVAEFPILLNRAMKGEAGSGEPVDVSTLETNLKRLNSVRNGFNHFRDQGWSIEIAYIVPPIAGALTLVQQVDEHGWAFRHAEASTRKELRLSMMRCRAILSRLEA